MAGAPLYDEEGKPVGVAGPGAVDAYRSGRLRVDEDGTYFVSGPNGIGKVSGADLDSALDEGWTFATPAEAQKAEAEESLREGGRFGEATASASRALKAAQGLIGAAGFGPVPGAAGFSEAMGAISTSDAPGADLAAVAGVPGVEPAVVGLTGLLRGDEAKQDARDFFAALEAAHGEGRAKVPVPGLGSVPLIPSPRGVGELGAMALSGGLGAAGRAGATAGGLAARLGAGATTAAVAGRAGALAAEGAAFGAVDAASRFAADPARFMDTEDARVYSDPKAVGERILAHTAGSALGMLAFGATLEGGGALLRRGFGRRQAPREVVGEAATRGLLGEADTVLSGRLGEIIEAESRHPGVYAEAEASMAKAVEREAERARVMIPIEGAEELVRKAGWSNRTVAAEKLRSRLIDDVRTQEKAAHELTSTMQEMFDALGEVRSEHWGAKKAANMERLVQSESVTGPIRAGAVALNAIKQAMGALDADAATYGVRPQARRIMGVIEEVMGRVAKRVESALPEGVVQIERDVDRAAARAARAGEEFVPPVFETIGPEGLPRTSYAEQVARVFEKPDASARFMADLEALPKSERAAVNRDIFTGLDMVKKVASDAVYSRDNWRGEPLGIPRIKRALDGLRTLLEEERLWGDAAKAQREINAYDSKFRDLQKEVAGIFMKEGGERVVAPERVLAFIKRTGKLSESTEYARMRELAEAVPRVARAIGDHYGVVPEAVAKATERAKSLGRQLDDAHDFIQTVNLSQRVGQSVRSENNLWRRFTPGAKVGGVLGTMLGATSGGWTGAMYGGPVGAMLGTAAEAALNPARAWRYRAYIERAAREIDAEKGNAVERAAKRWFQRQSPTMRVQQDAAGRAARETGTRRVREAVMDVGRKVAAESAHSATMIMNANARAAYLGAATMTQRAYAQRDNAEQALLDELGEPGAESPEVVKAAAAGLTRAAEYLFEKMPQPTPPVIVGQVQAPDDGVSRADADAFMRTFHAVLDPMSVLRGLEDGDVSPEGADALRHVYPDIYESAQRAVMDAIATAGKPPPYNAALTLGTLFDMPTTGTIAPEFVSRAQGAFMSDDQPDPNDSGMGAGRGAPRGAPMPGAGSAMQTQTQRFAAAAG